MTQEIKEYIAKYSNEMQSLYDKLRSLILKSCNENITEKLWAKLPSYYVGENFVRLIPFKDHINIEASDIANHKDKLSEYKITPKGMLQIYLNQDIPEQLLINIFNNTLSK